MAPKHGRHRPAGWPALLCLLALALTGRPAAAGLDSSLERMMGKQAQSAIEAEYPVLKDPLLTGYVERLGRKVVAAAKTDRAFTFKVIETEQVNALALPNGTVYVTTGLLRFAEVPDEVAAVIGHEVAHVTQHHSLSSLKKQFWAGVGLGVLGLPETAGTVAQVGTSLALLRYSRKDEGEADRLGMRYALAASYDPGAMVAFFRKLDAKQKDKLSGLDVYLSTHPPTDRRIAALSEAREVAADNPAGRLLVGDGYLARHLAYQAAAAYRQAVGATPPAAPHLALARAYLDAGEPAAAASAAARALELDPGDGQAAALLAQAKAGPGIADPGGMKQAPAALLAKLKAAGELRVSTARKLGDQQQRLVEQQKALDTKVKAAGRQLGSTGSREPADSASARALERTAEALVALAKVNDRLAGLAKETAAAADTEAAFARRLGEELAQPQPAGRLARLTKWADQYVVELSESGERSGRMVALAGEAAGLAEQAAGNIEAALGGMQLGVGPGWRGAFLASGSAMAKAEEAVKLTGQAMARLDQAGQEQSLVALRQDGWALNLAALPLSEPQAAHLDEVVAETLGVGVAEAAAARRREGGLGWGALALAGAPGGRLPEPAARPAEQSAKGDGRTPAKVEPSAPRKGERAQGALLVTHLLRGQIEREMAARAAGEGVVSNGAQ